MSIPRSRGTSASAEGLNANERFLRQLDSAHLSSFHWKATVVAGMGFLTDSYDLFVIGTVLLLLQKDPTIAKNSLFAGSFAANASLIGSTALIAAFIGALLFGTIADRVGRRFIYGFELIVLATGAIASAFAPNLTLLIVFRFILGIGIGGDYPVSATIISEHSNQSDRGKLIGTVFAMQAVGIVAGYLAALLVLGLGTTPALAWRVLLGLGAIPALATFWMRRQMPESPRFLLNVKGDAQAAAEAIKDEQSFLNGSGKQRHVAAKTSAQTRGQATSQTLSQRAAQGLRASANGRKSIKSVKSGTDGKPDTTSTREPGREFSWRILFTSRRFLLLLLGTAGCWFLMDYAYYGTTISSPIVINGILGAGATPFQTTLAGFLIILVAAVPGYIVAILMLDKIGRKRIQLFGFAMMTLAYGAIALVPFVREHIWAFAIAFGVSYFFVEFGPNTTTFIYPAEVFPTAARTTGHGIAAGTAKIGAFVGVLLFPILEATGSTGPNLALAVGAAAITAFLGFLLTFILPEPNQRSLEESERQMVRRILSGSDVLADPAAPQPAPVEYDESPTSAAL